MTHWLHEYLHPGTIVSNSTEGTSENPEDRGNSNAQTLRSDRDSIAAVLVRAGDGWTLPYTTVTTELDFFGGGAVGTPYTDLEYLAVPSFTGPGTLTGISIGLTATLGQNNDIIYSPTGTFRLPISPDTVRIPNFISTTHPTMELSRKRQTCRSTSLTAAALLPALVARRA